MEKNEFAIQVRQNYHELHASVTEKLKKLNGLKETPFKTNGQFTWCHDRKGDMVDITKVTNVEYLTRIAGHILRAKNDYEAGAKALKFNAFPPFKWCGFSAEDWMHDTSVRCQVIQYEETRKTLEDARSILSKYMTEEEKLANDLERIKQLTENLL